jgi:hypothetical protein
MRPDPVNLESDLRSTKHRSVLSYAGMQGKHRWGLNDRVIGIQSIKRLLHEVDIGPQMYLKWPDFHADTLARQSGSEY